MGIKEIIGNIISGNPERRVRLKELIEEKRIQKIAEDRTKSSDEREWERFHNENRQKQIKEELIAMRKQKQDEFNRGNILNQKNMFEGHNQILQQPNIFKQKGNMFL